MLSSWSHDYWPYPVNAPRNHSWADCNWRPPPCPSLHFQNNIANIPGQQQDCKRCNFIKVDQTWFSHLRSVVVSVALDLRYEYVPLPLVGAPVGRVQLDCDPGLASISLENKDGHQIIIWRHPQWRRERSPWPPCRGRRGTRGCSRTGELSRPWSNQVKSNY